MMLQRYVPGESVKGEVDSCTQVIFMLYKLFSKHSQYFGNQIYKEDTVTKGSLFK